MCMLWLMVSDVFKDPRQNDPEKVRLRKDYFEENLKKCH